MRRREAEGMDGGREGVRTRGRGRRKKGRGERGKRKSAENFRLLNARLL